MKKAELRRIYTERRRSITPVTRSGLCLKIAKNLFARVDFAALQVINCYLEIEWEVETRPILDALRNSHPLVVITAPRINPLTGDLEPVRYDRGTVLVQGPWQILEPQGPPVDPDQIDLVIIPLLCVDTRGHRVGYGKGFYDRFLSRCRPDCIKAGLSFFPPVETIEDVHQGDIALDLCVTPDGIFDFTTAT